MSPDTHPAIGDDTPWFVRAALGAVAWIGGFSMMLFLGACFADESLAAPVGILLLGAAVALRRLAPPVLSDLWIQLSLLFLVTGRLSLGIGLATFLPNEGAALAQVPVEAALFLAYPGTAPRIVAVFVAATALSFAVHEPWFTDVLGVALLGVAAVVSEGGDRLAGTRAASLVRPLAMGCALWSLAMVGARIPGMHASMPWLASGCVAVVGAGLAVRWLVQQRAAPVTWVAVGASAAALFAIGGPVPGTLVGLVSAGMAFRRGDRLWLGASLTALVAHGVHLYWQLAIPFMMKGWAMIGLGVVLLVIAALAAPRRSVA